MNELHDSLHRQVWDLIPWVAAGSASDADQQRVQHHLLGCDDCRQEMSFHHQLVQGMRSHSAGPLRTHSADAALQRLWAHVDDSVHHVPALAVAPAAASAAPVVTIKPAGSSARWLMAAVVVQSVGLAALAGLLLHHWRDAPYQTLSTPSATAAVVQLRLVPAASMPVGQLSALLSLHGLQIVESSHDGTVLGVALPAPIGTPDTLQALAVRLRAEPGVLLAEPTATALGR
jgi:hypothetical protein